MIALRTTAPVLASAARTASVNSAAITNTRYRGAHVIITATDSSGSPSVAFSIQGYDAVNDAWYTLLTSAAVTGAGTVVLSIYPGITAASNVAASNVLPHAWRVAAVHTGSDSLTYSVVVNTLS